MGFPVQCQKLLEVQGKGHEFFPRRQGLRTTSANDASQANAVSGQSPGETMTRPDFHKLIDCNWVVYSRRVIRSNSDTFKFSPFCLSCGFVPVLAHNLGRIIVQRIYQFTLGWHDVLSPVTCLDF